MFWFSDLKWFGDGAGYINGNTCTHLALQNGNTAYKKTSEGKQSAHSPKLKTANEK